MVDLTKASKLTNAATHFELKEVLEAAWAGLMLGVDKGGPNFEGAYKGSLR